MSEKINVEIGESIALYRKIKNKTRKELGEEVGVCYQQVKNYENGDNQIKVNKLIQISKVLGVGLKQLIPERFF